MTTEKKVASKAVPPKATSTTAAPKPARRSTTRRTSVTKTPVKRATSKTATSVKQPTAAKAAAEKPVTVRKVIADKKVKLGKVKMARDSFTMPKDEYAQLGALKARLAEIGQPAKKSELLRAGIKLLAGMTDAQLKAALTAIPVIKTGRPKKKK